MTEVTITIQISDEFISYVIDAAQYRSIDYWCDSTRGHRTLIVDEVIDEGSPRVKGNLKRHVVTYERIAETLAGIVSGTMPARDDIVDYIRRGVLTDDAGEIDADAADVIIQYAALNELVYG